MYSGGTHNNVPIFLREGDKKHKTKQNKGRKIKQENMFRLIRLLPYQHELLFVALQDTKKKKNPYHAWYKKCIWQSEKCIWGCSILSQEEPQNNRKKKKLGNLSRKLTYTKPTSIPVGIYNQTNKDTNNLQIIKWPWAFFFPLVLIDPTPPPNVQCLPNNPMRAMIQRTCHDPSVLLWF